MYETKNKLEMVIMHEQLQKDYRINDKVLKLSREIRRKDHKLNIFICHVNVMQKNFCVSVSENF